MKENILLVEDEEALCMALSDRLRKDGYAVDFVTDGDKGFEKATSLPFDLIYLLFLLTACIRSLLAMQIIASPASSIL